MADDAVIDRLARSLQPQRPYWSPARRFGLWAIVQIAALGVTLAVLGVRPDARQALTRGSFLFELAMLVIVGTGSALLACRAAVPGRQPRRALASAAVTVVVLALAAGLVVLPDSAFAWVVPGGSACAVRTVLIAAIPWLVLATVGVRGAVLDPFAAGLLAGIGPLAIAAAVMRLACPNDEGMHVLIWHDLPLLVGVAVSAAVGNALFTRWTRRAIPTVGSTRRR